MASRVPGRPRAARDTPAPWPWAIPRHVTAIDLRFGEWCRGRRWPPTEKKWDEADVVKVRSVAWLEVDQVVSSIWGGFTDGPGPGVAVQRCLADVASVRRAHRRGAPLRRHAVRAGLFEHVPFGLLSCRWFRCSNQQPIACWYEPDGITFVGQAVDCNRLELEPRAYHLVVASHAVHHVENLSNLLTQVEPRPRTSVVSSSCTSGSALDIFRSHDAIMWWRRFCSGVSFRADEPVRPTGHREGSNDPGTG